MSLLSTTTFQHFCRILALFLTLVLQVAAYAQTVVRVDGDNGLAVPNPPEGDTWDNAFKYLKDAITFARFNPGAEELWVASTDPSNPYRPDRDADHFFGTGDRTLSFNLVFNNVQLLGGFPPGGGDLADRDPAVNITVLSGELIGPCGDPEAGDCFQVNGTQGCNDLCNSQECPGCCELVCDQFDAFCCQVEWDQQCVDAAKDLCDAPILGEPSNAYHVVRVQFVDDSVRIDGFTVTGGLADGQGDNGHGAGMFIWKASPAVVRVTFTGNAAPGHGGAMHIKNASDPMVVNCEFITNTGMEAGALHTEGTEGDAPAGRFVNCLFSGNVSQIKGGAINPSPHGTLTFVNCTLANNSVLNGDGGGAIFTESAGSGAVNLTNCILWGNRAGEDPPVPVQIVDSAGVVTVTYSDVQGGWGCPPGMPNCGNIDADPLFVDAGTNYRLYYGSPCIDAADNDPVPCDQFDIDQNGEGCDPDPIQDTPDLDLTERRIDDPETIDTGNGDPPIVDMGAYEFEPCPWDLDGNCDVGIGDLLIVLADWGNPYGIGDLLALLAAWGPCPPCSVEPLSFEEELADACLTMDHWNAFVAVMSNPNASQEDKDRYNCWMTHYLDHCNKCTCEHLPECPSPDPFSST